MFGECSFQPLSLNGLKISSKENNIDFDYFVIRRVSRCTRGASFLERHDLGQTKFSCS